MLSINPYHCTTYSTHYHCTTYSTHYYHYCAILYNSCTPVATIGIAPLKLEVRQYIPAGFTNGVSNTTEHVWADVQTSAEDMRLVHGRRGRLRQQQLRDKERYKSYPVLMTAQRMDGQRCIAYPCKWLSTFVCFNCCQDGMHLYAGAIEEEDRSGGNDLGRPPTDPLSIKQLQSVTAGSL